METRRLDLRNLTHENGLDTQRLLPWPALVAPFEGSWCVIRPGTASTTHSHHEHEIFIAVTGAARIESGVESAAFKAGDVAYFPPATAHRVVNDSGQDFHMYSLWWDVPMSRRFAADDRSAS
jgi:mannose-6-phosphate isomerase-like protein (cupin superfamily)